MVIVDANVLIYAVNPAGRQHDLARPWLDQALGGTETVGLAWVALLAFIQLTTNPSIFPHPLTTEQAGNQVEQWLQAPSAVVAAPGARHVSLLRGLLQETGTAGNLTTDAHLAALALEHGADVVSFDRDFGRFAGIRHRLPG